jgi:hypothetical protein
VNLDAAGGGKLVQAVKRREEVSVGPDFLTHEADSVVGHDDAHAFEGAVSTSPAAAARAAPCGIIAAAGSRSMKSPRIQPVVPSLVRTRSQVSSFRISTWLPRRSFFRTLPVLGELRRPGPPLAITVPDLIAPSKDR